jgi:hypothetical protein
MRNVAENGIVKRADANQRVARFLGEDHSKIISRMVRAGIVDLVGKDIQLVEGAMQWLTYYSRV